MFRRADGRVVVGRVGVVGEISHKAVVSADGKRAVVRPDGQRFKLLDSGDELGVLRQGRRCEREEDKRLEAACAMGCFRFSHVVKFFVHFFVMVGLWGVCRGKVMKFLPF